ncbi:acetoin dehydrogenase dihydrolipoyllysine-residue acetyltransferase subunit [Prosthecomicrobium hirschii]|uniref:acetoin dehydrogenase dihydrolipoyllysine-residue acetyltransferase subunit n=1 Tax=Prosthecodimorpha hirschii TaxID=665126 RepID=UPI00221E79F6|nr:acetoin dehydrogenase dihydrolipoyllysine-residue acetyltransferase subunit [Prosthecomicrobium hirschii]MCW1838892.1 acetoin dehydrogenase dihydrolipoyllysine-residue acetyltransferase subunit [Prosthecomicrobium hirschii]
MSAAVTPVRMPRYGMTMTEGAVARWLVAPGETVAAGQDLAEIETTKITNVETAAVAGVLRRAVVEAGRIVPVGTLIGVIADAGVPDAEIDAVVSAQAAVVDDAADADAGPVDTVITVGTLAIAVRRTPGAGPSDAVPVVLVHGFGGDRDNWMFVESRLAAERPVVAFDLPGHGASGTEIGDGTLATLAGAVTGLMEALNLPRAHLVGHSLGGAVALAAAAARPEAVASLSLLAPVGFGPEIDGGYIAGFLAAERRKDLKDILGRLFADADAVERRMIDDVLRMKRRDGVPEALATIAAALFPDGRQAVDLRAEAASLACPVTVVWGEADRIIPIAHTEELPTGFTVTRIAGAGHMPQLEAPAEVVRALRDGFARAGA